MQNSLTKNQKRVLDFIQKYSEEKGFAPSLEEMRKHFKLASVSTAHHYVAQLKAKGYLDHKAGHPRAISIKVVDFSEIPAGAKAVIDSVSVPILGRANCGEAMLVAEESAEGYLKVQRRMLTRRDGIFALRASGNSMNRAKINGKTIDDGDFVLIDSEYGDPKNGDYVLSIIDGCANLKKFHRDPKSGDIMLVSESNDPNHKPIYVSSEDDFMINGKIIAVIKK